MFAASANANTEDKARPTITWYGGNYPPTFIATGPKAGQGYGDKALAFLFSQMPDYRNMPVTTSFNRGLAGMRERDGACMFGVIKTPEREKYYAFTGPVSATLPNRVIMLKSRAREIAPFLDPRGEVELELLVRTSGMRFGVITDRFYSTHINSVLDEAAADNRDRVRLSEPRYGTLLYHSRIDYTFGFPYEAAYQFAELGAPDAYISFPIKGEPPLLFAHVACSKTPLGHAVVAKINALVAQPAVRKQLYGYFTEWLDDAARADFLRALQAQ
ncbi:MAG: TIGR02285 family protein [Alphaproteobacteria bacterium]|nr:TIGR02285 family protein [Alphaproteobacteria bacterium]